jgi:CheY-like chemotaxis protein
MLPKMDGLTVLENIRKDAKNGKIPVVILSNLSQDSTVKQGLAMGANGYLLKAQYLPLQAVNEVKKFLS